MITSIPNADFVCTGCRHILPRHFMLRTPYYCYMCDPNISIRELLEENGPVHYELEIDSTK
jgi:hypothetical protein